MLLEELGGFFELDVLGKLRAVSDGQYPKAMSGLRTSLETIMPLDWYFRTDLREVSTSSVGPPMGMACYTYRTISAALRPAPATMMVCGEPFFFGALLRLSGALANFSRKPGRLARVLGSCHEVVS